MKTFTTTLTAILLSTLLFAQDITGSWQGALNIKGTSLRVVFNIKKTDQGYTSTMDSPDQGATGIPVTTTSFKHPDLTLTIANAGIQYTGKLIANNQLTGNFKQAGQAFPLNLSKAASTPKENNRPQHPKAPFPYLSKEVTFENTRDGITLAGTYTHPKEAGSYPAVVLISGSGPQDRNEEIYGHKPFLVLADYLTKNGIAVLRFDDRGTGKSTGKFKGATTIDFARDVEAAVQFLQGRKEVNSSKIGLIGHSEGGMIAPLVAAKSRDIGFIVLLSGPGVPGSQILLAQQKLIAKASGVDAQKIERTYQLNKKAFDIISENKDTEEIKRLLTSHLNKELTDADVPKQLTKEDFIKKSVQQTTAPWMLNFIQHDPAQTLKRVKCPVLALNGSKDLQVPAKENLVAIEKALKTGGNNGITVKELPNLNHLFQECKTGVPSEYGQIQQTFSPKALNEINLWILSQTR